MEDNTTTTTTNYEVIVGNVGLVISTPHRALAIREYGEYCAKSAGASGLIRVFGEDVTLLADGEPIAEHTGHMTLTEEGWTPID